MSGKTRCLQGQGRACLSGPLVVSADEDIAYPLFPQPVCKESPEKFSDAHGLSPKLRPFLSPCQSGGRRRGWGLGLCAHTCSPNLPWGLQVEAGLLQRRSECCSNGCVGQCWPSSWGPELSLVGLWALKESPL